MIKSLKSRVINNPHDKFEESILVTQLSTILKTKIFVHSTENIFKFKVYGANLAKYQNNRTLHIVRNECGRYDSLQLEDFGIKNNLINPDSIPDEVREMLTVLPSWIQDFFGFRTLLLFIYNERTKEANEVHIKLLESISKYKKKYLQKPRQ